MSEKGKVISLHSEGQVSEPVVVAESSLIVTLTVVQLRSLIRQEMEGVQGKGNHLEEDVLLTGEEAASLLNVNVRWMYRHANKLPFTKRLSRRNLRFSKVGLLRWRDAKRA